MAQKTHFLTLLPGMNEGTVSFAIFSVLVDAIPCEIAVVEINTKVVYGLFHVEEDGNVVIARLDEIVLRRKACTSQQLDDFTFQFFNVPFHSYAWSFETAFL